MPTTSSHPVIHSRQLRRGAGAALLLTAALLAQPALAVLKPGDKAPDFSTPSSLGGQVSTFTLSSALKQGPVVLYFYPAAFTTGCTIEAHLFAEATDRYKAPPCWCGRTGCLETYISGKAFEADYMRCTGRKRAAPLILEDARRGERWARDSLDRYVDRLGRALAVIADIIDPDVIVLAGGMSNVPELYERVPDAVKLYVFSDIWTSRIVQAQHGDSSGVRGAAWLWPLDEAPARQTATA